MALKPWLNDQIFSTNITLEKRISLTCLVASHNLHLSGKLIVGSKLELTHNNRLRVGFKTECFTFLSTPTVLHQKQMFSV